MKRVVVTGMGAITPIGLGVDAFWRSIKENKVGIVPISYFDTTGYKAKVAAEVHDFVAKDYLDPKSARRMERFSQFAVAASKEALEDAGIDMSKEDPYRVGVSIGSGVGSLPLLEKEVIKLQEKGHKEQRLYLFQCLSQIWLQAMCLSISALRERVLISLQPVQQAHIPSAKLIEPFSAVMPM